jgi:hypothetical protein
MTISFVKSSRNSSLKLKTKKNITKKNITKKNITKKNITKKNIKYSKKQSGSWDYIPLDIVNKLESLAEYYNVSHKARGLQKSIKSDKGFLTVYREAGGKPSKFEILPVRANKPDGENWAHHRSDFCNRRYSMIKNKPGYELYDNKTGLPSVMHVNMLMWACSPDANKIKKNWKKILATLNKIKNQK